MKYGSKGPRVIIIQTFLKAKGYYIMVDGHYGAKTKACVKWYQRNEKLLVDGIFGPMCNLSMPNASRCKYQEFNLDRQTTVIRMDRNRTKAEVLNPKRQTLKQMFKSIVGKKPNIIVNGTLFDTRTMTDLAQLKKDCVQVGVGYYDEYGLGIDFQGHCHISKDVEEFKDFMGFSPAVYLNGKINKVYDNLSNGFINHKHPRTMIQINDKYINVFVIRGRSKWRRWYGANFNTLVNYCNHMAKYDKTQKSNAGNFDGGGSTGAYTCRGSILGWGNRRIANGIAFYVEE